MRSNIFETFIGAIVFSIFAPTWVAIYIILFDLFWVLRAINTALHLLSSFSKLKLHATYDWNERLDALSDIPAYKKFLRYEITHSPDTKVRKDLKEELFRLDKIDLASQIGRAHV